MPLVLPPSFGSVHESNLTAAANTGTTLTAGATVNTKGAYASIGSATTRPSYGLWIAFRDVAVATAVQNMLVDVAYAPDTSGTEQLLIPDLTAGAAPDHSTHVGSKSYYFPIYIPSGMLIRMRAQASTASDTVRVSWWAVQNPLMPFIAGPVSVYGRDATNSRGTSVTPGNNAFGTWTELLNASGGSGLSRPHRFWTAMVDSLADTSLFDDRYELLELGIGPNNTTVSTIWGPGQFGEEGGEVLVNEIPLISFNPCIVDATNAKLWARLAQTSATEARGVMAWGTD